MSSATTELPPIVAEHIAAINAFDADGIMKTFVDDAIVNDAQREVRGAEAIRKLIDNEFIRFNVTMEVREITDHYGDIIVRAKYDGTFPRGTMPDPVIMTNYFSIRDGKITNLAIILDMPSPY
jgi:hypothetical protein